MKKQGLRYLHYGDLYAGHSLYIDVENPERPLPFIDPTEKLRADQFVNNGDIIYILTSETVEDLGKSLCLSNPKHRTVVAGTETTVMQVARQDIIEPRYLNYLLQTPFFQRRLRQYITGMKVFRVHPRDIARIAISVPSLTDQKKIIALLDSIHFKIRLNQQINDHLFEIALTEYRKLSQQSRCICTLQDCTSLLCRGGAPKYCETGKFRALNQRCIRNHKIISEKARTIEEPKSSEKLLRRGDVLICSTGTGTLGRVAQVLFKEEQVTVDSHVTIVRPAHEALVEYLGCWALSSESQFESMAKGSTGQTELPRTELAELEICLPNSTRLSDFSEGTKPLFEAIQNSVQENQGLERLRDALLPKLISGEIDVSRIDLTQLNGHLSES